MFGRGPFVIGQLNGVRVKKVDGLFVLAQLKIHDDEDEEETEGKSGKKKEGEKKLRMGDKAKGV